MALDHHVYPIQCTAADLPRWFFKFMVEFLPVDLPERYEEYSHDGQGGLSFDFNQPEAVVDLDERLSDSDKDSVRIQIGDDFNTPLTVSKQSLTRPTSSVACFGRQPSATSPWIGSCGCTKTK